MLIISLIIFSLAFFNNYIKMANHPMPVSYTHLDVYKRQDMIKPNEFCITFKNVTFSYREKTVFQNFNLSLKSNSLIAIIGPSGCGDVYKRQADGSQRI